MYLCLTECKQAVLAHNFFRAGHQDTPPVSWDQAIAATAKLWAEELIRTGEFEHSPGNSEFRCARCGENLYMTSSIWSAGKVVSACRAWWVTITIISFICLNSESKLFVRKAAIYPLEIKKVVIPWAIPFKAFWAIYSNLYLQHVCYNVSLSYSVF